MSTVVGDIVERTARETVKAFSSTDDIATIPRQTAYGVAAGATGMKTVGRATGHNPSSAFDPVNTVIDATREGSKLVAEGAEYFGKFATADAIGAAATKLSFPSLVAGMALASKSVADGSLTGFVDKNLPTFYQLTESGVLAQLEAQPGWQNSAMKSVVTGLAGLEQYDMGMKDAGKRGAEGQADLLRLGTEKYSERAQVGGNAMGLPPDELAFLKSVRAYADAKKIPAAAPMSDDAPPPAPKPLPTRSSGRAPAARSQLATTAPAPTSPAAINLAAKHIAGLSTKSAPPRSHFSPT